MAVVGGRRWATEERPSRSLLRKLHLRLRLPIGRTLPDDVWQRRHRGILALLWLHVVGLVGFGIFIGNGLLHSSADAGPVALAAILASWGWGNRAGRAALATGGLMTSSAILVHLSGGYVEMHFHFFVVIGIIALYQDWTPFLLAIGYVVLHHGVFGTLYPRAVYNHPDAWAHPWKWAAIHGAFVLAASGASLIAWHLNEYQAVHDALTDLPNRTLFLDRLGQALARAARRRTRIAVLFVDLDRFKAVNDSLGHEAGDRLLVALAARLRACLRDEDTLGRLSGDEFLVLLEDIAEVQEAIRVAERIDASLRAPFALSGHEIVLTSSIGIALSTPETADASALLRAADTAMYRAKTGGKARNVVFDPSMNAAAVARLALEVELRRAVAGGELRVHYQPTVDLATGRIAGVEALVRWEHPERGLVLPGDFIPLAEETGLILAIGEWVLMEGCRQVRAWQLQHPSAPPLELAVNLSARELVRAELVPSVARILRATELDPHQLKLEITESTAMADAETTVGILRSLQALGIRLAIDDFGTGYSSLSYLKRFPVDTLKIDKSFVDGLGHDPEDTAIVQAVVTLADTLGLAVTAEGVETAGQLLELQSLGCALGQGYYFAKPLPPEALGDLLTLGAASIGLHAPLREAGPVGQGDRRRPPGS